MPENFTLNVVLAFITTIACAYGFAVSINQLRKGFNYQFYWFGAFAWFFGVLGSFLLGVAILLLLGEDSRVAFILVLLNCSFVLLKADALKREEVEPVKLAAFIMVSVLLIIAMYFVPNAVSFAPDIFGGDGISFNVYVGLFAVATYAIPWAYYCHCIYLVHKRAPAALKRYSRIYFVGTSLVVVGVFSLLSLSMEFFFILVSFGCILMAYAYSCEPKLLFVLPFTALRLTVLDTESGLPLFTHTWNRQGDLADEDLFSGMLQGISIIVRNSLKRGDVQEIRVADAIMIVYRNPAYPIAFVLAATRPSRTLRDGLK
ncbi:MAG TPA: hypothetical protein VKK79_11020, partial [Candidatus Lokiarchaeia archaeon]|nr:hypothetical protein [Candidatus Lokiarchaeia archaeon]